MTLAAGAIPLGGRLVETGSPLGVMLPPQNALREAPALLLGVPQTRPLVGSETTTASPAVPAAEASPSPSTEPEKPEQEQAPVAFLTHQVAEGETLSSIGGQYGIDVEYLVWNNPEIGADPDSLIVGEELVVPGTNGIVYDVQLGDTVGDIALTYDIDPAEIVAFAGNDLVSPDVIQEGMRLVLPGAVPPPPPPPAPEETPLPETPAPTDPPAPIETEAPPPAAPAPPVRTSVVTPVPAPPPSVFSSGYIWPVFGPINSFFGPRWGSFHTGLDIGVPSGSAVGAAASGQVVLAVSGFGGGYGNYVIVRHGDGSQTLYAHLSAIGVALGQYVDQGETIGAAGCTGWCTGPHLHFEVRIGGTPVDPLIYLP